MRAIVLGAGAIGGVVGGLLARAGGDVLLLARGAHLAALRQRGLRVERPEGSFVLEAPAQEPRAPLAWRAGDVIFLATKTQDAASALRELAPPAHVPIVCLTNGLEAERVALRHARVVHGALVLMPATHLTPGVVQAWAAPIPGVIDLGRYPHGASDPAIAGELRAAGFSCELRDDIMRWKRGKLLSNLMNGAEALCGPAVRRSELAERARAEARACFAAAGLQCTTDAEDAARRAGYESKAIAGATRGGGSTWQSLVRGSSLEVEYLNGEIVLLGRLHGVPTPINEALVRVVGDAARAGVTAGSMSIDALAARLVP